MGYLAVVVAVLLCGGAFAAFGCCDSEADTVFDAGEITVAVPNGWKAFGSIDVHAEENGAVSKSSVIVCKGGTYDTDIFTKPYVKLDYRGKDIYLAPPLKVFYDNIVDLAPLELGGHTWECFSFDSLGYPMVMLYVDEGDDQYLVTISCGLGEDAISLNDAEVKRIIASLTVKGLNGGGV